MISKVTGAIYLAASIGMISSICTSSASADGKNDLGRTGEYLTRAADCEACHTVEGGKPFVGGRSFTLPFGIIYSPNITPDKATGIGDWSDDEFVRALHQGIGKDGEHLYPAFPYASYTQMTRQDALSIKAYLFTLRPIHSPAKENSLEFPFNQRWGMAFWNAINLVDKRFEPDPTKSPEWNRGNYLAIALGHCGECHTPRTVTFGLDRDKHLAGAMIEGWRAYNLTSDTEHGLGKWSGDDLESYLSTGHSDKRGTAAGPMEEVVRLSLSHLTSDDIRALTVYLQSVEPQRAEDDPFVGDIPPALANATYVPASGSSLGQKIFEGSCASCHDWNGAGLQTSYANLRGVMAVSDSKATNLIQVVLKGASIDSDVGEVRMPPFANSLGDSEIAAVANFVVERFGGKSGKVTTDDVAKARKIDQPVAAFAYVKWAMLASGLVAFALIAIVWRRLRRHSTPKVRTA
jgi:mono/diheme cytochrome c family protein